MKKLVTSFLVLLLLFAAVGCQSNSESANTDKEENGQVTIKFWWPGTDNIEKAARELVAAFEASHPNIKVEYVPVPWGEYFQKLSVGYAGGTAPDVHGLGYGQLVSSVSLGQYKDLNEFINKDNWDGKEDYFSDILEAGQWQEGQYGLLFPDTRVLVWRKDFFKEAGLDPEQPPKSYDELFEYARKLAVLDDSGKTVRGGIDLHTQHGEQSYYSLMLPNGMEAYKEDGTPLFDSKDSIEMVKKVNELVKDKVIIPSNQQQLEGSEFRNGRAAMGFVASQDINMLAETVGYEHLGWSLPPQGKDGGQTALSLGTFVSMNKDAKHPEEAWEFIKFWFEKENLLKFTSTTGMGVPRQSLKKEFVELLPQNEVIFEAMNDSKGFAPSEHWNLNMEYLRLGLEESYSQIRPVEEALKENAKMVRSELGLE